MSEGLSNVEQRVLAVLYRASIPGFRTPAWTSRSLRTEVARLEAFAAGEGRVTREEFLKLPLDVRPLGQMRSIDEIVRTDLVRCWRADLHRRFTCFDLRGDRDCVRLKAMPTRLLETIITITSGPLVNFDSDSLDRALASLELREFIKCIVDARVPVVEIELDSGTALSLEPPNRNGCWRGLVLQRMFMAYEISTGEPEHFSHWVGGQDDGVAWALTPVGLAACEPLEQPAGPRDVEAACWISREDAVAFVEAKIQSAGVDLTTGTVNGILQRFQTKGDGHVRGKSRAWKYNPAALAATMQEWIASKNDRGN